MTLRGLIEKAMQCNYKLTSADIPILYNGRTFDFDVEFTPVNGKNSEYVNHVRLDIKEI